MSGPRVIDMRTETFVRDLGQRLRRERMVRRYALKDVVRLGADLSHTSQLEKGLLSNVTVNTALRHLAVFGLTLAITPVIDEQMRAAVPPVCATSKAKRRRYDDDQEPEPPLPSMYPGAAKYRFNEAQRAKRHQ